MTRDKARQLVAEVGGQPVADASRTIDALMIGEHNPRQLKPGAATSTKQDKAASVRTYVHCGGSIRPSDTDF
jgi:hypothetical protein